jgi:hypothetical protein
MFSSPQLRSLCSPVPRQLCPTELQTTCMTRPQPRLQATNACPLSNLWLCAPQFPPCRWAASSLQCTPQHQASIPPRTCSLGCLSLFHTHACLFGAVARTPQEPRAAPSILHAAMHTAPRVIPAFSTPRLPFIASKQFTNPFPPSGTRSAAASLSAVAPAGRPPSIGAAAHHAAAHVWPALSRQRFCLMLLVPPRLLAPLVPLHRRGPQFSSRHF